MSQKQTHDIIVNGKIDVALKDRKIRYIAACPAEHLTNYSGSGLPYSSPAQAFENTPNQGTVEVTNGKFRIPLRFPNSYYMNLGTDIVPPTVFLTYTTSEGKEIHDSIVISEGIPYRTLTYPDKRKEQQQMFYKDGWAMPVRTQEQILRQSQYPAQNTMPRNHWGVKPPL
jgi:hypothetical protein